MTDDATSNNFSPQATVITSNTDPIVDDADLLAILAQPTTDNDIQQLLSPSLPELQSDDEGSELSLTLLDDTQQFSRKRSRSDFEDPFGVEENEDPFGFEFLDVVQLEDTAPLAKKPFVDDAELSLDFLNDFDKVEAFEPFTAV